MYNAETIQIVFQKLYKAKGIVIDDFVQTKEQFNRFLVIRRGENNFNVCPVLKTNEYNNGLKKCFSMQLFPIRFNANGELHMLTVSIGVLNKEASTFQEAIKLFNAEFENDPEYPIRIEGILNHTFT